MIRGKDKAKLFRRTLKPASDKFYRLSLFTWQSFFKHTFLLKRFNEPIALFRRNAV